MLIRSVKEEDGLEDLGVDGRMLLKCILIGRNGLCLSVKDRDKWWVLSDVVVNHWVA